MSKRMTNHAFSSSSAKDYIRSRIDRNIIKNFKQIHYPEQKLTYFGLPGEKLLDILNWREFLGYCTVVENMDVADELELNVLKNHLEHIVHLVRANIDELILTKFDKSSLRWPYEIINLDYCGGLVNSRLDGTSQRLEALRALFERQVGAAFILFLTLNLRDRDGEELDDLVKLQEEDFLGLDLDGVNDCFNKHRELNHAGLLKIYVPIFLDSIAKHHSLVFIPPILYQGTQQMIHFAIQCVPYNELGAGRVTMTKERIDIINLPLLFLHSYDKLQQISLGNIVTKVN